MKEIRKQIRSADQSNKEERIYERSPDGVIRSRKPSDYGNERIEEQNKDIQVEAYNEYLKDEPYKVSREVLNELWTSDKILKDGYWYVKLTDVIKILGDYSELYENESQS